ncbi:MAG: carboxypeptidase regulatory-like domain-containing protein, partial [Chitinophagaceae bacterium]
MQLIVAPIVSQSTGKEVANLQATLLLFIQKEIIRALDAPDRPTAEELKRFHRLLQVETKENIYGDGTTQLIQFYQLQQQLGDRLKGNVDESTAASMNNMLRQLGALDTTEPPEPPKPPVTSAFKVTGTVSDNSGAPLNGYTAEVFIVTIDNAVSAGKTTTDRNGQFSIGFARTRIMSFPDLEVRAYREGEKIFSRSAIRFNAKTEEVIDVIVPAEKVSVDSEFNTLLTELRPHLGQLQINDLKEDDQAKQITYLSNKTGWDGRITAMVASAHKLGNSLRVDPSHVYALLRSGIPATEDEIKSVSLEKAEAAIKYAIAQN